MIKSKLIYTLVVLLVVACQKEELNVTVPRDDFSVVPGYADNVKGQLQVKFRELSQDLEVTPTAAGLETDNDELTEAVNRIVVCVWNVCSLMPGNLKHVRGRPACIYGTKSILMRKSIWIWLLVFCQTFLK